ncbi:hypothetical protein MPH_02689 [Macrophomina phaseolina MS6]|uniref:Uncharacterized protein n=1 Tax=Macrophomina phaseolina (strain MS6) TaxID=1126212 RepID=K2S516_MACPH|nr:hypothetical protein MPH_02689 [Macrophomina phaseolina MS6]
MMEWGYENRAIGLVWMILHGKEKAQSVAIDELEDIFVLLDEYDLTAAMLEASESWLKVLLLKSRGSRDLPHIEQLHQHSYALDAHRMLRLISPD